MAQEYPSQGADYTKLSAGDQDVEGGESKKKSPFGKVKDKAKKLKSKMKVSSKKKTGEHGEQGITGEHGDQGSSSSSSSGEEEEESPKPESYGTPHAGGVGGFGASEEARKDGAVHGGGEDYQSRDLHFFGKKDDTSDDITGKKDDTTGSQQEDFSGKKDDTTGSLHEDLSGKKDDTTGLQEELGKLRVSEDPAGPAAGAAWYGQTPSSDDSQKRQEDVPSALGQESSGVSSGLASGLGGDSEKKHDEPHAGGLLGSTDENLPRTDDDEKSLKPVSEGIDNSGRDLLSSEVTDQSPKADDASTGAELKPSGSQKGWMQRASEGVASVKNALLGSPKSSTPDQASVAAATAPEQPQKSYTDTARDAVISTKDTVASKLPSSTGPTDAPASEHESGVGQQKGDESQAGVASRALEAATGLRDTVATKLGYGTGTGTATGTGTGTGATGEVDSSTTAPTDANKAGYTQKAVELKDAVASKLGYGGTGAGTGTGTAGGVDSSTTAPTDASKPSYTQKAAELKDVVASKLGYGGTGSTGTGTGATGNEQSGSKLFTPDEHDQALSEKITNLLTLGGGSKAGDSTTTTTTPASSESTATSQNKGVYDKVTGAVGSLLGKKTEDKPASGTTDSSPLTTTE